MASFQKFDAFPEAVAEGKHDLGADQLAVALTNTAPQASDSVLADITEVSYTSLSSRNLTTTSSSQTSGLYKLVVADLTLTASGDVGPFRYAVIYNDTATSDDLIGFYDYGESITLHAGEEFKMDFDGTAGLLQIEMQ
jgi:hypothetical protein